ncbi:MAG TPA: MFS transporter [Sutterella sp.]|nr:MFS transporter [Sutterella sp.]
MTHDKPLPKPTVGDALILALASSVGPFSVNAYLPGLELMSRDFSTDLALMGQTLTAYLLGFALCSLFIGAISDALGRRRVLLGGMLGFAAASIAAMLTPSFGLLCAMRFIQGLTAGVGQVVTQAVVRDRFTGLSATKLNGMIAMIFSASPALAPVIGGIIVVHFGWQAVFVFLASYALVTFAAIWRFLPESLPLERRQKLRPGPLFIGYANALRNPAFMSGALANSFSFSGTLLYTAASADFILRILKMAPDDFGYLSFPMVFSSIVGASACAAVVARIGGKKAITGVLGLMVATSLISSLVNYEMPLAYPFILIGPLLFSLGTHFCMPEMITMNLDYFPKTRGLSASVNQCLQSLGFAMTTAFIAPLVMGAMWRYSLASAVVGLAALIAWRVALFFRPRALSKAGVVEEHF